MAQQTFTPSTRPKPDKDNDPYSDNEGWRSATPGIKKTEGADNSLGGAASKVGSDNGAANSQSLANQEESGKGFYRPGKGDPKETAGKKDLQKAESGAGDADSAGLFKREKGGRGGLLSNLRKRKGITGIIIGLIIGGGGGYLGFGYLSGPGMIVQASHVLQRSMIKNNSDTADETGKLFRFADQPNLLRGAAAETRLASLGTAVFGNPIAELKKAGVTFERGAYGAPTKTTFDLDKIRQNPRYGNQTDAEMKTSLSEDLGLPKEAFGGEGGTLFIDEATLKQAGYEKYNVKLTRLLTHNTLGLLNDGKIVNAIKFRYLTRLFNLPSLFHPLDRKIADAQNNSAAAAKAKQAAEEEQKRMAELAEAADNVDTLGEGTGKQAEESIKSKSSGIKNVVRAMDVQGGACFARDIAAEIPAIDRARVVLPAVAAATSLMAVGEQLEVGGPDVTTEQVGAISDSLYDKNGNSIFGGLAFQALQSNGSASTGEDISPDYKQGFQSHTTANLINTYVSTALGGKAASAILCNGLTLGLEAVAEIVISAAAEFGSGGALTPAVAAAWAAETSVQFAGTTVFMHYLQNFLLDSNTAKKLAISAFSGPQGGSLLAYGARAAAGVAGIASGGLETGSKIGMALASQDEIDQQQFRSQSFGSRLFAIDDYRSLTGRMAQSMGGGSVHNINNLALSITGFGGLFGHAFSSLIPRASADVQYDWGFSEVGIPDRLKNDPNLADPYDNAVKVAPILTADTGGVIERAKSCFGADITNETPDSKWDVKTVTSVDPNSDDYISANCNPFGTLGASADMNWARVVKFVFSTKTIKAVACYAGAKDSAGDPCPELGIGEPEASTTQSTTAANGTFGGDSSAQTCPTDISTDGGIQDGYDNGKLYKIRVCNSHGTPVNVQLVANFDKLMNAAKAANIPLQGGSGFRTMAEQTYLYGCYQSGQCNNGNIAAKPGYSNHQMGLAVDFHCNGPTIVSGDACFVWLKSNGPTYNFYNFPDEAWHWSVDGH